MFAYLFMLFSLAIPSITLANNDTQPAVAANNMQGGGDESDKDQQEIEKGCWTTRSARNLYRPDLGTVGRVELRYNSCQGAYYSYVFNYQTNSMQSLIRLYVNGYEYGWGPSSYYYSYQGYRAFRGYTYQACGFVAFPNSGNGVYGCTNSIRH